MRERNLSPGLRLLLALIGTVAVGAGGMVVVSALRIASASWPDWRSVATAGLCAVAVWGGLLLLRGAARGRIRFRRTRHPDLCVHSSRSDQH